MEATNNQLRYFRVMQGGGEIIIDRTQDKTQPAIDFLNELYTLVQSGLKIHENSTGVPFGDMVTSVVSGYEAKRGIFKRIWDLLLNFFGWQTTIQELSCNIEAVDILDETYPSTFFTSKLRDAVDFLCTLRQPEAGEFFESQFSGPLTFPHCNENDPSRPNDISNLNARESLVFAKELFVYFHACLEMVLPLHGAIGEDNRHRHFSQVFPDISQQQVRRVSVGFDSIFLAAAHHAMRSGNLSEAVDAASCIRHLDNADKQIMVDFVNQCLTRNDVISAWRAVSRYDFNQDTNNIARSIYQKALTIATKTDQVLDVLFATSFEMGFSDKGASSTKFIDLCLQEGKCDYAFKAALSQRQQALITASNASFEKIANVFFAQGNYRQVELAIDNMCFDEKQESLQRRLAESYLANDQYNDVERVIGSMRLGSVRNSLLKDLALYYFKHEDLEKSVDAIFNVAVDRNPTAEQKDAMKEVIAVRDQIFNACMDKKDYQKAFKTISGWHDEETEKMAYQVYDQAIAHEDVENAFYAARGLAQVDQQEALQMIITIATTLNKAVIVQSAQNQLSWLSGNRP